MFANNQNSIDEKEIQQKEQSLNELLNSIIEDPSIPETQKLDVIIHLTALTCAVVAVQPIPFADLFILSPIQVVMVIAMSRVLGNPVGKNGAGEIIASIVGVVGWGVLAQQVVLGLYKTVIPFMGAFTTIPLVYGATTGLGYGAKTILEARKNDQKITDAEIKKIQEQAVKQAKEKNSFNINTILDELKEWKNKASQYQQYCEKLEQQQKKYEDLEIQNKSIYEEYKTLQKTVDYISELEKQIQDSQIKINKVNEEKEKLEQKLQQEYLAKLQLKEQIKNSDNIQVKQELEKELSKRIEAEQLTQYALDEASKLEHNLLIAQREQEAIAQQLKNKEIENQKIEEQLNILTEERMQTLQSRFAFCYPSLIINNKVIQQIMLLDSVKINLLERQFGLLENNIKKVIFTKTIQSKSLEIQEIEFDYDDKLYIHIENNNKIRIVRIGNREWNILCSDEFLNNWLYIREKNQIKVAICINHLEVKGVNLEYPHSSKIKGSSFNLRELRPVNSSNEAIRVFYTFTNNRIPLLLCSGDKDNENQWYTKQIAIAEQQYSNYLSNENNVLPFDQLWSEMSQSARAEAIKEFMIT